MCEKREVFGILPVIGTETDFIRYLWEKPGASLEILHDFLHFCKKRGGYKIVDVI